MFAHHKKSLCCPVCKGPLTLDVYKQEGEWLIDGLFSCQINSHYFPLIEGLPRLISTDFILQVVNHQSIENYIYKYSNNMSAEFLDMLKLARQNGLRNSKDAKVANLYSFQWKKYSSNCKNSDRIEFDKFTDGRLSGRDIIDKTVGDFGAGEGRFASIILEAGAAEVVCVDLGEAIAIASKTFRNERRVMCVQASIYDHPFNRQFDLVLCIGVLQHLPEPQKGFLQLVGLTRKNGRMYVWIYGYSVIVPFLKALRSICRYFPVRILWWVAFVPALVRFAISRVSMLLEAAGLHSLAAKMPFGMYRDYDLNFFQVNTFDHLSAPIINFYGRHDLEEWLMSAKLTKAEIIERFPQKAGSSWGIDVIK